LPGLLGLLLPPCLLGGPLLGFLRLVAGAPLPCFGVGGLLRPVLLALGGLLALLEHPGIALQLLPVPDAVAGGLLQGAALPGELLGPGMGGQRLLPPRCLLDGRG